MAFDQDKFRQLAKEQGYSDDEIDAHLGKLSAATGKPFGESSEELAKQAEQELRQAGQTMPSTEPKSQTTLEKFFDWSATPLGTATLGLGAIGIGAAAKKGLQNRKSAPVEQPKIEPVFTPEPVKTIPTQPAPADKLQELTKRVEAGKQAGLGVQPPVQPGATYNVPTANVPGMPPAVQAPVQGAAPVQPPVAQPAPQQAPVSATQAVLTDQSPAKAIQLDVAKQLDATPTAKSEGKITTDVAKQTAVAPVVRDAQGNVQWPQTMSPAARAGAEAFAKQYPTEAAKLEKQGQFGILGFGSGDNNLYNTYGAEGRKAVLEYFHGGKPLGPYEPNYETLMKTVRQGVPAGDVSGLMARLPAEAEAGNFGQLGTPASFGGKKGGLVKGAGQVSAALKAGGPALLLMSMADLAKAKTQEEKMNAGLGILGAILPPGLDIFPAGEGSTISEKERARQEEFAMLGSPYYQTQQAKNLRQAKKVGAGRGIAPPSQYQR